MRLPQLTRCMLAILCMWVAQAPATAGEVLDRIKASGVMKVATDPAWPPYSWKSGNGEWQGFDAGVAQELGKRLGVKVEFVTPAWDVITAGDWKGAWDLSVGSMSPTEDRAKVLSFPATYYYAPTVLAVNKDNREILTPGDASGKRIGALKGSIFEKYLRREPMGMADEMQPVYKINDPVITTYETSEAAFKELTKDGGKSIDAMVDDMMYFLFLIKDGAPVRIVGQPLYYGPSSLAIEPGDPEFESLLKDTIGAMHDDGTLSELSNRWFGVDLTRKF